MKPERPGRAKSLLVCIVLAVSLGLAGPAWASFGLESKFSMHQHDDWEPAIAADDSGHVYWATTRYGGRKACKACPDPAIVHRRSDDNGVTWSEPRFLCRCPGVGGQHDPVLATDDRGRVFAVWMNDWVVNFARSDDHGLTWARNGAIQGTFRYGDKPWIGTSADGDDVYVHFNAPESLGAEAGANPYAVYSHNAGETWSLPRLAAVTTRYFFADGLTVTPDGAAFAAVTAPRNNQKGDILLLLVRSLDGGRHWKTVPIARPRMQRRCPGFAGCPAVAFLGARVAVASDDAGRVYALWTANREPAGPARVYLRWSDDRGETWSAPRPLSGAPHAVNHEFPMIAATGDGDVRVAWMDNRTGRWNTWYRRSTDGGATWAGLQPGRGSALQVTRGLPVPVRRLRHARHRLRRQYPGDLGREPELRGPGRLLVRPRALSLCRTIRRPLRGAPPVCQSRPPEAIFSTRKTRVLSGSRVNQGGRRCPRSCPTRKRRAAPSSGA